MTAFTLMPGTTFTITPDGTDATITICVPLDGRLPWVKIISKSSRIRKCFTFRAEQLQARLQRLAEEGEG